MLPDLDSLRLFVRAAEMRSLSQAAEATHIAVGAASRRIALLEHQFRAKLLERTSRGVRLTLAGQMLFLQAKQIVEQIYAMQAAMAAQVEGSDEIVRLFSNTAGVTWFLPRDLARFRQAYPRIGLSVQERISREVVEAVRNGDADVGVFTEGVRTDGLKCLRYRADRLAAIVPQGHSIRGRNVRFDAILDHDLITLESTSDLSRLMSEKAVAAGKPLRLRLQMKSFQSVCRMVRSGFGVGILPVRAVQEITQLLGLRSVPLADAWAQRPLLLALRDEPDPRPAVKQLVDHLVPERRRSSSVRKTTAAA